MTRRLIVLALLPVLAACAAAPVEKNVRAAQGLSEIACLGAVATRSGSSSAGVVDSTFAPSGTKVKLYVPETESNWSCVATADGQVLSVGEG
jgi:hypothetical protein